MFAAILKASPTNPPGLSSSKVSNFGSAAKLRRVTFFNRS